VSGLKAGFKAGMTELENFLIKRLSKYSSDRNNPLKDGLSKLSPWLHFGEYYKLRTFYRIHFRYLYCLIILFRSDICTKMYLRSN